MAIHSNNVLDCFDLTASHRSGIMAYNMTTNYSMTCKLQSNVVSSGIEWLALTICIPCMAHILKLGCGEFMSGLGVKGCSKSREAHECNHQFREYTSIGIGMSQRLHTEGNARINKVVAMRPGLANIFE
jgi:hypothetical protein